MSYSDESGKTGKTGKTGKILFEGFPEVPVNAFDFILFPPTVLLRSYKAICPLCYRRTETYDSNNRDIMCLFCINNIIKIQTIVRRFLVRNKLKRLKKQELMHRFFIQKGINGVDFTKIIINFL
jgi:hypothetical protein